ncbi:MAG: ascorbate system component [Chloroflexota bacterium]|nr:ascorbate system component [Chloroflexota bacterium]
MVDGKNLTILIVCTFGAGSSQLLKMNVDDAIRELKVENVNILVCDSGSYRGQKCDGILTTTAHAEMVKGHPYAKAYAAVKGIFNTADIKEKVKELLIQLGVEL